MGRLFRMPFPGPPLPRRGHGAVPVRPHLDDLRRQHRLDPGRRVQLLDQPVAGAGVLRACSPGASRTASTGAWPPCCSALVILCHAIPGLLRGRRRHGARAAPARPQAHRLRGAHARHRLHAHRVLVGAVRAAPRAAHRHGLGEARRVQGRACSPTPPAGCSSSPSSASCCRWPSSSASARSSRSWRCCRPWGSGSTPPRRSTSGTPACCRSSTCRSTCSPRSACRRWCDRSRCSSTVGPIDAGGRPRAWAPWSGWSRC